MKHEIFSVIIYHKLTASAVARSVCDSWLSWLLIIEYNKPT